MTNAFIQALKQKPILADGAIGTLLYARGASPEASFEQLNLSNRALMQLCMRQAFRALLLCELEWYHSNHRLI